MVRLNVLVVGAGMIAKQVILPTVFQQRRAGTVDKIMIAARRGRTLADLREQFPDEPFDAWPDPDRTDPEKLHGDIYRDAIVKLEKPAVVIVATPDHLHTPVILEAVWAGFDVVVQKPLCLKTFEAQRIVDAADRTGCYVYTDFHKRHDEALRACQYQYRRGMMGQSLCSHAWLEEKREMPLRVFSQWAEKSSSFEYVGCHYVDMFHFITGERPVKVIAFGQKKFLPQHGLDAFDAVQAIIEWESGAVQYVQTSWVLPDSNPNLANQGFQITCTEGEFRADNADRNSNFVTTRDGYQRFNPYFFKPYLDWNDFDRDHATGYGEKSLLQPLDDIRDIYEKTEGLTQTQALAVRKERIACYEKIRPLPRQAMISTAVIEAARMSLSQNNRPVLIDHAMNLSS